MATPTHSSKSGRGHGEAVTGAQSAAGSHTQPAHSTSTLPPYLNDDPGPSLPLFPRDAGRPTPRAEGSGSAGQPLPPPTRELMESHYGADFSQVRAHTGQRSADAARAMGASAYTLGRDMVFAEGEYEPGTEAGDRLIAHELTHVLQQSPGGSPARPQRAPAAEGGDAPETETEAEAERNAEAVTRGGRAEVRQVAGADAPQLYPARVGVPALEVHRDPDVSSPVIFTLRRNQPIEAGEVLNGWQRVTVSQRGRAQEGFVPTTLGLPYLFGPRLSPPPNPYSRPLLGGLLSLPTPGVVRTPYLARIVRNYVGIYYVPPPPTQPGETATVTPGQIRNFGDQRNIFVTVTEDAGGEWVRARHGETEGWMRRSDLAPVSGDQPRDVEQATTQHVVGSESHGRPGHYSRDDRDNVGLGSWTCGRIAGLMGRYRRVFRRHQQEAALYALFGGRARFDEIQSRFRNFRQCSDTGGFVLSREEGRLFENAGRHPLIREAEEEQMGRDFVTYLPDPAVLRPIYPWIDADDTVSEMALAMFVSMRHRGETNTGWQGAFRSVRQEYEQHPERFPGGEADFLRAVGLRLAGRHGGIRNRYLNVVTAFRESRRRYSLRRTPEDGDDADAAPPSNAATPDARGPARH